VAYLQFKAPTRPGGDTNSDLASGARASIRGGCCIRCVSRLLAWARLTSPGRGTRPPNAIPHERITRLLAEDVNWVATAATPEQAAELPGPGAPDVRREAVWTHSDEGREAPEAERKRQLAEHNRAWGLPS
jgi:hypothetical protein